MHISIYTQYIYIDYSTIVTQQHILVISLAFFHGSCDLSHVSPLTTFGRCPSSSAHSRLWWCYRAPSLAGSFPAPSAVGVDPGLWVVSEMIHDDQAPRYLFLRCEGKLLTQIFGEMREMRLPSYFPTSLKVKPPALIIWCLWSLPGRWTTQRIAVNLLWHFLLEVQQSCLHRALFCRDMAQIRDAFDHTSFVHGEFRMGFLTPRSN